MDYSLLAQEINNFLIKLREKDIYKELLELKEVINNKYQKEVFSFNQIKIKLSENLEYAKYIDITNIKKEYQEAKTKLYEKEEVEEFLKKQRILEDYCNKYIDNIKNKVLIKN